ncbi:MAG: phosphatidate cytidylyltransferase [Planctomycetota bacterium]|nr:phosphatidate cytidylyltransferase [Planctomycetota bacterium]
MGKSELGTRFIIGPILLLITAGLYYSDTHGTQGYASAAVLALLSVAAVAEFTGMFRQAGFPVAAGLLMLVTLALHASAFFFGWTAIDRELYPPVIGTMALLFPLALRGLAPRRMGKGLEEMGGTLLGFILLAWPMYLAQGIALRHVESLFFVVLVCKFGDIGGYLFGMAFGRHKLIPHISPGKTIQGSVGSLLASCGMAVWLSPILLFQEVEKVTGNADPIVGGLDVTLLGAILIGIMLNCTAQIGDLVESLLKRRCKVKDSSRMLPAHGGVLDLTDSLLFSFPAYLLILTIQT